MGAGPAIPALIAAGATLLTSGGSGGAGGTWELPSGVRVDGNNCWQVNVKPAELFLITIA